MFKRICRTSILLLLLAGALFTWEQPRVFAATGILKQINFQGKVVTKTSGTNISDGDYSFTFTIYDAASNGSSLWTETKTITVTNGIFQTLLGSSTALPSSIDFNTDSLYLGINFNSDGEMSPRVRLAAVPYAFNALKVAGLTVTDTTGTLTIPNGSTITLQGTDTYVGRATTDTLTNKSIGSTGLIFSGASTDITTGTDEALTIAANGTGDIIFGTDADTSISFSTGFTNCSALETVSGVLTCGTDDTGGGGGSLQGAYDGDTDGSDATLTLSATDGSIIIDNPSSSGTGSAFTFKLSQSNATASVSVLDIIQASNAANGVNLTANAIDGETGLAITTNALTSGKGLSITSSSTALTGALQEITLSGSNAANTGSLLKLSNTGTANANTSLYIDHRATGTNNLALRVDDQSGDTTPLIVDGDGRLGIGTSSITGTTERLLQVGSATNRGNTATYGEIVTKGFKQIQALSNVKDVYIYDTSLDSDGGRWIDWADTEKLSWFTESLDDSPSTPCNISSMDRCYSDRFPRKALLVVTTDALYIFDATNGNMWMKFSQNASGYALGADTNNDPSSVTALNGVIYVGTNGSSAGGLYVLDFLNDRMWNIDGTDRSGADVGIGSRNSAVTYNSDNNTSFDIATVGTVADWGKINDVSVAVLKNSASAIAAATGPNNGVTFVGLATDSGLTLINLATQKVTQYSDATDNDYNSVVVTSSGKLYGLNETLGQAEMWLGIDYNENVATKVNGTPDRVWDENSSPPLSKSAPTIIAGAPDALDVIPNGSAADGGVLASASVASNSDLIYVGTNQGLTEIDDHATAADGWSKFYTITRQTPFMVGAIRRMHTMDDTSGNVTNAAKTSIMTAKGTPTYGVQGVRGKAMSFNGTTDYLCSDANSDGTCDNDTTDNMSTGGWTISMWFKHSTTISGTDVLFSRCYNTTPAAAAGCVAAAMTSTGTIGVTVDMDATFSIGAATNNSVYHASVQTFNDNQWHFLAITRAATTGNINTLIDGKPIGQTAGVNTTLDASQILSIGADCSVGAACSTGANFWDGSIDDFQFSANGSTTASSNVTSVAALHRMYNDSRPLLNKKVITVTDATTATSTTIGDSGETWIPQEFAGQIVTLTGGTGAGQTRRIVSNTATVLTVSPAFTTAPDTTTDFKMDPEALYGASNSVTAIGVSKNIPIGESRMMCAGTNDSADGGGITCFNHQAGPNVVADIYHADSKYLDDLGTEWTGTGYDNIQSIDMTNRTMIFGTGAHTWIETQDVHLGNALDYFQGKLTDVRNQLQTMSLTGLAGQIALDVGLSGGADLAEWYYSDVPIPQGALVSIASGSAAIQATNDTYQPTMIGVVSTAPGLILGEHGPGEHAVALVGRVPVLVTDENGVIKSGDRVTSSFTVGFGMKALQAGRVIGTAMESMADENRINCPDDAVSPIKCYKVMVFVNLSDFTGVPLQEAMQIVQTQRSEDTQGISNEGILTFLREWRTRQAQFPADQSSEVFTDRLTSLDIFADSIHARSITADSIEGLQIYTDHLSSLSEKVASLAAQQTSVALSVQASASATPVASPPLSLLASVLEYVQTIMYKGNVIFFGRPTFNNDSAGFAVIKSGASQVKVTFSVPFDSIPVVVAAPDQNVSFSISDVDVAKFFIRLSGPALQDTRFSWTATSVEKANTFESEPFPSLSPSPTSTQSALQTETTENSTQSAQLF